MTNEFKFSLPLKVRIDDINYGNHTEYQKHFSFFQEAQRAYFEKLGYLNMRFYGYNIVQNKQYKKQIVYHGLPDKFISAVSDFEEIHKI